MLSGSGSSVNRGTLRSGRAEHRISHRNQPYRHLIRPNSSSAHIGWGWDCLSKSSAPNLNFFGLPRLLWNKTTNLLKRKRKKVWGWKDGSVVDNTSCSSVLSSVPSSDMEQLPPSFSSRVWCPLLVSAGTCTHTHTHSQKQLFFGKMEPEDLGWLDQMGSRSNTQRKCKGTSWPMRCRFSWPHWAARLLEKANSSEWKLMQNYFYGNNLQIQQLGNLTETP